MSEKSPAAARVLDVLTYISSRRAPVSAQSIATALGLPRSSVYQLLDALVARGYAAHFPEEHTYGLGLSSFEVSSAYARQEPLARAAKSLLERVSDAVGESGHLAVLRGPDVVYLLEERAPHRPSLVTDVGVRLPAHLTASGRAMLGCLPQAQVRALYPSSAVFDARVEGAGPASLRELREVLASDAQRGFSLEQQEVTAGFSSVAVPVRDRLGLPLAAFAVTFLAHRHDAQAREAMAARLREAAAELERRLG